ncbi:MAG TPA: hypothetical protein VHL54_14150 [Actinomycetota bacterium]|nr:hypothetical protein [Actinomycetota bacterium]
MPVWMHHCAPESRPVRRISAVRGLVLALAMMLVAGACNGGGDPEAEATPSEGTQLGQFNANSPVTLKSVGPIVVGMTLDQVAQAAGVDLTRQPDYDQAVAEKNCAYVSPSTIPGYVPPPDSGNKSPLAFMIVDGKLARIDILGGDFATAQGIKVGSEESQVLEVYGNGQALPPRAFIGPPYRYLTATPRQAADQNFRMVFESDGAKVVQYRVGQLPHVENKQGCTP